MQAPKWASHVFCSGIAWDCHAGLATGAVQISPTAGLTPLEQVPKQVWSLALAVGHVPQANDFCTCAVDTQSYTGITRAFAARWKIYFTGCHIEVGMQPEN